MNFFGPQAAAKAARAAIGSAGPAAAAAILARHAADPDLAAAACDRIFRLAFGGTANTKDLLGEAGVAGLVAAALRGHPEHARVQQSGCFALGAMAYRHPANQATAGEAGAAGLVASAMRGHQGDADVQANGCYALYSLAENHPANTAAAREAGCVQLIAAALRAYPEDEMGVQSNGRGALEILEPGREVAGLRRPWCAAARRC